MSEWIVIGHRIEGDNRSGYTSAYYWDHKRFVSRGKAISHGTNDLDLADDFLIGEVMGQTMFAIWWMDDQRDDLDELSTIANDLGFRRDG